MTFRILPRLDRWNRGFWQGGQDGELRFWRCQDCGLYLHPPQPLCPQCHGKQLAIEAVSGRGTLASFSINHQQWMPGPDLPFVVAIVEMPEQPALRLTTNLINCNHDTIRCDMPVRVVFEHHHDPDGNSPDDDVWLPLFEPEPSGG